jgi:hypothetical protein
LSGLLEQGTTPNMSMQKDTEEMLSKKVQLVSQQNFAKLIFRETLEKYDDFIRSK